MEDMPPHAGDGPPAVVVGNEGFASNSNSNSNDRGRSSSNSATMAPTGNNSATTASSSSDRKRKHSSEAAAAAADSAAGPLPSPPVAPDNAHFLTNNNNGEFHVDGAPQRELLSSPYYQQLLQLSPARPTALAATTTGGGTTTGVLNPNNNNYDKMYNKSGMFSKELLGNASAASLDGMMIATRRNNNTMQSHQHHQGFGVHQQIMNASSPSFATTTNAPSSIAHHQLGATATAAPGAIQQHQGSGGFSDDQLALALEQQHNQNIFGMAPMQLQHLLLVQMQMAQLQQQQNSAAGHSNLQGHHQQQPGSSMGAIQAAQMMAQAQQAQGQHLQQMDHLHQVSNYFNNNSSSNNQMTPGQQHHLQYIQPSSMQHLSSTQGQTVAAAAAAASAARMNQQQGETKDSDNSRTASASDQSKGLLTGRSPIALYMSCDDESLSEYQCLVRKNIELFEATQLDADSNAQGRNKPIVVGQVGIRCRHCTLLPPKNRSRGAMYYPAKLEGLYQAAQNQANGHLVQYCNHVPPPIRAELVRLKDVKSSAGGGKKYWADGVKVLGVYEDVSGLRFKRR